MRLDPGLEQARALHVVNDGRAWVAREHVLRVEHQLPVRVDDLPVFGDHADAVAVAVEGEAQLRVRVCEQRNEVREVLRLGRVGVVVGKAPVDFRIQRGDFAAELPEEPWCNVARHAVAAIDRDLHRPGELHVTHNPLQVGVRDLTVFDAPGALRHAPGFNAPPEFLDRLAGERAAGDHHLDAVVIRRIVAAGEHDRAAAPEVVGREVSDRRGHHADIDNVRAACRDAFGERRRQFRSGQATVAADGNRRASGFERERTQCLAYRTHHLRSERGADDAANVIGAKYFCWD